MIKDHGLSGRQACKQVQLPRSTCLYIKQPKKDEEIIDALHGLIAKHPSIGFWMSFYRLRLLGYTWNHKTGLQSVYILKIEYPAQGQEATASQG